MKSVIAIGIIVNCVSTETKWLCLEVALYTELGHAGWQYGRALSQGCTSLARKQDFSL